MNLELYIYIYIKHRMFKNDELRIYEGIQEFLMYDY